MYIGPQHPAPILQAWWRTPYREMREMVGKLREQGSGNDGGQPDRPMTQQDPSRSNGQGDNETQREGKERQRGQVNQWQNLTELTKIGYRELKDHRLNWKKGRERRRTPQFDARKTHDRGGTRVRGRGIINQDVSP